jgi:hypothetical protein
MTPDGLETLVPLQLRSNFCCKCEFKVLKAERQSSETAQRAPGSSARDAGTHAGRSMIINARQFFYGLSPQLTSAASLSYGAAIK